jgi:hypothetical protein
MPRRESHVLAVVAVVAVLAVAGAAIYALTRSSSARHANVAAPASVTPTTSIVNPSGARVATGADYLRIIAPTSAAQSSILQFLTSSNSTTTQSELDQRTAEFVKAARATERSLASARWPVEAAANVRQLIRADRAFIDDVAKEPYGVFQLAAFQQRVQSEAETVRLEANKVRQDLGLPPAS